MTPRAWWLVDATDAGLALRVHRPVIGRANRQHVYVLCPLHVERTPSCRVRLRTLRWWCFGCRRGGSARALLEGVLGGLGVDAPDVDVEAVVAGWVSDGLRDAGRCVAAEPRC